MDNLRILLYLLLTLLTGRGVYSATSDFTVSSDSSCKSDIYVNTYGTKVRWSGQRIRDCEMKIHKSDSDSNQICVELTSNSMQDIDNTIEFLDSSHASIWTFNKYSSTFFDQCTSDSNAYIKIQMDAAWMGSFSLKVYTKNSNFPTIVKDTFMTIGVIIGVVIGVIVLLIIVIAVIVCCCCMKGRRTQGHVYRQQGPTQATVATTHQMVPQGQPQTMYPQQPVGFYPAQPVQYGGYPAQSQPVSGQPLEYNQYQGYPPPPSEASAPSAPPSDCSGYMEKPPPYTT